MDTLAWVLAAAVGTFAGVATGLVPGLHANTLATLLLSLAPAAGEWGAIALVAAAAAHACASAIPSTYVGVPGEDTTLSVLPAHRLLREGRAAEAVRIAVDAVVLGALVGALLVLPLKWLVAEPARLLAALDAAGPWILALALAVLPLQERRRGLRAVGAALFLLAGSGALGLVAGTLRLAALLPVPATPLFPLLSGLFGSAGLAFSVMAGPATQASAPSASRLAPAGRVAHVSAVARGIAAASWTSAIPGVTAAVGASVAMVGSRTRDARRHLACMSALGAAHQAFALAMLWVALRARTGTALAVQGLVRVDAWASGRMPSAFALTLAALVAAAAFGRWATLAIDARLSKGIQRLGGRRLPTAALGLLAALVLLLSGPLGLLLFALATTFGLLPMALGVRRVHLAGALLIPALLGRLGVA